MLHNSPDNPFKGRWALKSALSALLALSGLGANADTITVPGDAETIQGGIDLASSGDTVLVGPGLYNEHNIRFNGMDLELLSSEGPGTTTIDGGGLGPVITVINDEGRGAIIDGFTIRNGRANEFFEGGGIFVTGASATIRNNIITGNSNPQVDGAGGGIKVSADSDVIISDNLIANNTAFGNGGGLRLAMASAEIRGNSFMENQASGTSNSNGGAISLSRSVTVIIDDNVFIDNQADRVAGAISSFVAQNVTISNNQFERNFAGVFAGAIRLEDEKNDPPGVMTVSGNHFEDNSTNGRGGAIHAFFEAGDSATLTGGSTYNIIGNTFLSNTALNDGCTSDGDGDCANGGALQVIRNNNAAGKLIVRGNIFEGNYADDSGAAQFNKADLVFDDNIVRNNSARFRYPGISCEHVGTVPCVIRRNEFRGNMTTESSGTTRNAGGIYIKDPAIARVENNFFAANSGDRGGAIYYINQAGGVMELRHNSFHDNQTAFAGGGTVYVNGEAEVTGNIFQGDLRGVRLNDDSQTLLLDNNNFFGQSVSVFREGTDETADVATLNSESFASGNVAVMPAFADPANEDLHLTESSPLIDMISCTRAPPDDINSESRPFGSACDMGADEFMIGTIFADGFEMQ